MKILNVQLIKAFILSAYLDYGPKLMALVHRFWG